MSLTEGAGERNDANRETKYSDGCWVSEPCAEITRDLSLWRDEEPLVELWRQSHGFGELIAQLLL